MTADDLQVVMERLGKRYSRYHLSIVIPDGPTDDQIEKEIMGLKEAGFHAFIQLSAFGQEIIITDISHNA